MAHSPRKPSSSRKPDSSDASDDLFGDAPEATSGSTDDSLAENWTLDDGPVAPSKPTSLPSPISIPPPASVRISPISIPDKRAFESNPAAAAEVIPEALPLTVKEVQAPKPVVEAYDPFEIDEDLPAVPPSASVPAPVTEKTTDRVPELTEEFDAPPVDSADPLNDDPAPVARRSPAGLLAAATVLVALLAVFIGILYANRPDGKPTTSRAEPTVPLTGQVVRLSAVDSGWRSRQPGDLVSTVDVTLPTPSRQQSALLPMVKFTTDPAATKAGFLRFIFLDPDGKISGDVRVVKVNAGVIDPLSSGAVASGPGTATVYGSLGFMDRPGFVAYATGSHTRWSVEVSESADYNAKEEGWKKLETFDLSNASDP